MTKTTGASAQPITWCHGNALAAGYLVSITTLSVPQSYQCHSPISATVLSVPQSYQCHSPISATVLSVSQSYQCHLRTTLGYKPSIPQQLFFNEDPFPVEFFSVSMYLVAIFLVFETIACPVS